MRSSTWSLLVAVLLVPAHLARAQPVPDGEEAASAAETVPAEVRALFPAGVLEELPATIAYFIAPADFEAIRAACPQPDAARVLACVDQPAVSKLLEDAYARGVVLAMLALMDVTLPAHLTASQREALATACGEYIEPWARCTIDHGIDDDACAEPEDALATCVSDDDAVNVAYLALQDDKKAAWGNADQYVALRGLLSLATLEDVRALRTRCPQDDDEALLGCLRADGAAGLLVTSFETIAKETVTEAVGQLAAAGHSLSDDEAEVLYEKVRGVFLTFPIRTTRSLSAACLRAHPELETLTDPAQIDQIMSCLEDGAGQDPVANPAFISTTKLRDWLALGRTRVEAAVRAKETASQERSFGLVLIILSIATGAGVLVILLMPFFVRRRYPDATGLGRTSLIASGVFIVTMLVLGGALLVTRTVQGEIGVDSTSPRMRVADAAFTVLERDDYVQSFSELSQYRLDLIKTPLREIGSELSAVAATDATLQEKGEAVAAILAEHWARLLEQPELKRVAKNAKMLAGHVETYRGAIGLVRSLDGVLGYVPVALALLAVLLYLLPMRKSLTHIITSPVRHASGETGDGLRGDLRDVGNELKVVGPYLLLILLLLPIIGVFIAFAVEPLMEILINVALLNFVYVLGADATGFAIQGSILGSVVLLGLTIVIYVLALAFFAKSFRTVLRARFHEGRRLSEFKSFWIRGGLALLGLLLFPVLFAEGARFVQTTMLDKPIEQLSSPDLWLVPVIGAAAFLVLFWALRGIKALGMLRRVTASGS